MTNNLPLKFNNRPPEGELNMRQVKFVMSSAIIMNW